MFSNLSETPKVYFPSTGAVNVFEAKSPFTSNSSPENATARAAFGAIL
jgi:hypothetical protein